MPSCSISGPSATWRDSRGAAACADGGSAVTLGASPGNAALDVNTGTVTLKRETWTAPDSYPFGEAIVKPLRGGETMGWKLV